VIPPPDVISQIGLGVPIQILYEISIIAVRIVERKRAEAEAAEAAADAAEAAADAAEAAAGTDLDRSP
jgi:sec-independent protein translocase protein TatC